MTDPRVVPEADYKALLRECEGLREQNRKHNVWHGELQGTVRLLHDQRDDARRLVGVYRKQREDEREELLDGAHQLWDALRLTQEYIGDTLLPPIRGWSWYDALNNYPAPLEWTT